MLPSETQTWPRTSWFRTSTWPSISWCLCWKSIGRTSALSTSRARWDRPRGYIRMLDRPREINAALKRWTTFMLQDIFINTVWSLFLWWGYTTSHVCTMHVQTLYELLELLLQSSEVVVERANPCPLVGPHSPTRSEHRVELIWAVHRLV